eukprot:14713920-Heterocapsa_arctica.AAC.1
MNALTGPSISIAVQPLLFVIWAFSHLYLSGSAGLFSSPLSSRGFVAQYAIRPELPTTQQANGRLEPPLS